MGRSHLVPWAERFKADESGAAIVEFAFIIIPLLIILLGGFDLGYQAYLRSVVQSALNDVARSASMEAPAFGCDEETIEEQIDCAIKRRSDAVARNATYTIEARNYFDFSGVDRSEKLVTDYNNNGSYDEGDCFVDLNENGAFDEDAGREGVGGADDVVFYEVTVTMPRLFPLQQFVAVPAEYEITAETAIRNQPYARQQTPPTVCD